MDITDIKEIRIFPPMAIARFGSSPTPMENYELGDPDKPEGFRKLIPEETFVIQDGKIVSDTAPADVQFRDSEGRIKPVAPFFEVWAKFTNDGDFEPLTIDHFDVFEKKMKITLDMGNYKVFRRTGDENDKITASVTIEEPGAVPTPLQGKATNFLSDTKFINFGTLQFLEPTVEYKEVRFRYTPAAGIVYGHTEDGIAILNDEEDRQVYNASEGAWVTFPFGSGYPDSVQPVRTIAMQHNEDGRRLNRDGDVYRAAGETDGVPEGRTENTFPKHLGYLDDSCDGIFTVKIEIDETRILSTYARVAVGPPDFAPQHLHIRHILDEMNQFILGVEAKEGDADLNVDTVIDFVRRAKETVQLMDSENLDAVQRKFPSTTTEPPPYQSTVSNESVLGRHSSLIGVLQGLKSDNEATRTGAKVLISNLLIPNLRLYTEVGNERVLGRDINNKLRGAQKMPTLMRGPRAENLAITRRLINILMLISKTDDAEETQDDETEETGTSEEEKALFRLIVYLRDTDNAKIYHGSHAGIGGQTLAQLFATPNRLITYLKQNSATVSSHSGERLVIPKDPQNSAFYRMITETNQMMGSYFESYSDDVMEKNGFQIVEDWINSLPIV